MNNHARARAVAAAPATSPIRDEIRAIAGKVLREARNLSAADRQFLKDLQRPERYEARWLGRLGRLAALCPEDSDAFALADQMKAFIGQWRAAPAISLVRADEDETAAQAAADIAEGQAALAQNDLGRLARARGACLRHRHYLDRLIEALHARLGDLGERSRGGLASAALVLVIAACSGASAEPIPQPPPTAPQGVQVARIVVVPANAAVPRGGLWPFSAEVYDANDVHIPTPPGVVWSVDSTPIGSVEAVGPGALFRAATEFRTTVRARIGAVVGTAAVTVTP